LRTRSHGCGSATTFRDTETAANLLTSLHANGVPDPSYPPLEHRVAYLFNSGASPYERHPELLELIPPELYERGRQLATRLAESVSPIALLHGDLTPSNILDGGAQRGLVAIDPAPCLGDDLAFEAIDLLLWQADDVDTIAARAKLLAPAIGADTSHLFEWCTAFAAMTALELAESPNASPNRVQTYVALRHRPRGPRPNAVGLGSAGGAGHDHGGLVWWLGRLWPVAMGVTLERELAHLALDRSRQAAQPAWGQQVPQRLSDRLPGGPGQPPRGKTRPGWSPGGGRCAGCG
jgi:hypothetical protein